MIIPSRVARLNSSRPAVSPQCWQISLSSSSQEPAISSSYEDSTVILGPGKSCHAAAFELTRAGNQGVDLRASIVTRPPR